MRSMIRWTAKLTSRWLRLGFLTAMVAARSCRHISMSARNAASTSVVPRLAFDEIANRSNEPEAPPPLKNETQFRPISGVFLECVIRNTAGRCFVTLLRGGSAVVDGEFIEIREYGERQLRRPGVTSELQGRIGIFSQAHRRLLCLKIELRCAPDAKTVVWDALLGFSGGSWTTSL